MKDRIVKTTFIPAIIFFIFCITALVFVYKIMNRKNAALQEAHALWQVEELKREDIRQLDKSLKALEKERATIDKHFAQSSDVVPFLDTIERLGSSIPVVSEISSVDVGKNNSSLSLIIRSSGTFEGVYKFLTLLENAPYELEFTSVDIQKSSSGEEGGSKWEGLFRVKLLSYIP